MQLFKTCVKSLLRRELDVVGSRKDDPSLRDMKESLLEKLDLVASNCCSFISIQDSLVGGTTIYIFFFGRKQGLAPSREGDFESHKSESKRAPFP